MPARAEPSRIGTLAFVLVAAASACSKKSEASTAPKAAPVADDIDTIEARLRANAEDLRGQGVALAGAEGPTAADDAAEGAVDESAEEQARDRPSRVTTTTATREPKAKREDRSRSRCERICDLAASTCELRARICDLARVHEGDARYAGACEQASSQCEAAQAACARCS